MDGPDRARVEKMASEMMQVIAANYRAGPSSRDRLWEALNALSFAAATVIAGTGSEDGRRDTRAFFDNALDQNVADIVRFPPSTTH